MAISSDKPVIFLSHWSEDEQLAKAFHASIEADFLGFPRVFLASYLQPGELWKDSIRENLFAAQLVCVLRSERAETRWVAMEIGAAWVTQKDIIPLCYGDLSKGKLGDILGDRQALDVKDRDDLRVLYDTIARKLRCNVPTVSSNLVTAIADFHAHYHPEQEADRYALANTEKVTIDYEKMRDGTLKALSPITETLVWTIPARNRRPLSNILSRDPVLLDKSGARENECFFCEG